ncbi:MAG: MraY family glycosyltransferase [Christensenella sp.]|uniref:MraY family glycosyltransferase n=1 Tax=Christensenella sp. TaxID=1935934 RepID=UPI002B21357D|nr:MraY family glycosyltransferase [Christensenella sp.]MEA5001870.1 MraY family glycosyltransferase [Christensenella sp.]
MELRSGLLILIAFLFTFFMTYTTTPLVRKFSIKVGAVDIPKDSRRMHSKPIPTMGGLAIFVAFAFGVMAFVPLDSTYVGLLLGALMITIMGMFDDIYDLKAWIKLLVQIGAALVVCFSGIVIKQITLFDQIIYFGNWAIPITVLWIVAITNTINLIDGLDGLACGISAISSLALLAVSLLSAGNPTVTVIAAILAGSCLGFLPYNLNPAKIFMGDVGATFLGFVLAVISIQGFFKVNAVVSFVIPFLVLGLPIFDTLFAIIRRLFKGQSPFHADRKHLHHRLVDMGMNQKQSVVLLYAISALLAISAILFAERMFTAAVIVLVVSFVIGCINWFVMKREHIEMLEKLDAEENEVGQPEQTEEEKPQA